MASAMDQRWLLCGGRPLGVRDLVLGGGLLKCRVSFHENLILPGEWDINIDSDCVVIR